MASISGSTAFLVALKFVELKHSTSIVSNRDILLRKDMVNLSILNFLVLTKDLTYIAMMN
jgi:hypothetical protein